MLSQRIKDYWLLMRFDKPIGIFLLLWPTLAALWLASQGHPSQSILLIFLLGTIIMRAAGCVINDLADRRIDQYVRRTQDRPLTAKRLSIFEAMILLVVLLIFAFFLALQLTTYALELACIGALVTVIYPFMKRWVSAPQAVLGLAFSWGIPMAFAAVEGDWPIRCSVFMLATMSWILVYDTEYAMVDREDDLKIGVHSTAIWFGTWDLFWVGFFQAVTLMSLVILGVLSQLNLLYFMGLVLISGLFIHQLYRIRFREGMECFQAFLSNHWVGLVLFLSVIFGHLE